MSQFFIENSAVGVCSIPVAVPQVELVARTSGLPLCQFSLAVGQVLAVPYVSVHFIGYSTLGYTGRVNTGLPIVYVGVYYQAHDEISSYSACPIMYVGTDVPGVAITRVNKSMSFTATGIYRLALVNNHASSTIVALVTGSAQIFNVTTSG